MFLVELNDHERRIFLELAHHAMKSSGKIKSEEEEIFRSYAYECEMPDYAVQEVERAKLVTEAQAMTQRKRRIMLMELWGIILADEKIEDREAEWMEQLAEDVGISSVQARRICRWGKDFVDIISDGYRLIGGRED